jgi:uncharacterized Zn finger protein (UPF0148 family)
MTATPRVCPACGRRLPRLLLPGVVWCVCGTRVTAAKKTRNMKKDEPRNPRPEVNDGR